MRVARAIMILTRRREYLRERVLVIGENASASAWMKQEVAAIDSALPILQAEHDRRALAVMEQLAATDERKAAAA